MIVIINLTKDQKSRPHHLPLVGEEEDDGKGGGALDTPLGVVLLSV